MSLKFQKLIEQFVFNSYSFAKELKNLKQQNEELKAIIAKQTTVVNQNNG